MLEFHLFIFLGFMISRGAVIAIPYLEARIFLNSIYHEINVFYFLFSVENINNFSSSRIFDSVKSFSFSILSSIGSTSTL